MSDQKPKTPARPKPATPKTVTVYADPRPWPPRPSFWRDVIVKGKETTA